MAKPRISITGCVVALIIAVGCGAPGKASEPVLPPATIAAASPKPTLTRQMPTATSATPARTAVPPTNTPSLATAVPIATSTPAPLLLLEICPQPFGRTETFQVGLGDLDGDGDLDAVFANMGANDSQVWLNDGKGHFADSGQELTQQGHGLALGDLDTDGDLDVFMTSAHYDNGGGWSTKPSRVYLNDGQGRFLDSGQVLGDAQLSGNGVNLVDVDGDGDLDAHVVYYEVDGMADKVYLNDSRGRFTDSGLALSEETIAWGDLDADGDVDVFAKANGVGYRALLNDGAGRFTTGWQVTDSEAMYGGIALGDFDGDGDLDALVANGFRTEGSFPTWLLWNDGAGQFADSGQALNETLAAEFAVGDLDLDGDLDVFVSNMDLPDEVWLNDGGRLVDSGLRLESPSRHWATRPTLGDLDSDGDLDIIVAGFRGTAEVWLNNTPVGEQEATGLYLGQIPPGLDVEVFAPGLVSIMEGKEYKIAISPDLRELFFTRRTPGGTDDRLWTSHLENGNLSVPELAPFAFDGLETDACFTPDGQRLYFNSVRPLPGEQAPSNRPNVWFVDKAVDGWSEPQWVGPPFNDYRPVYFSIADDGTLYFTRSSPRGIYYAEPEDGHYLEADRLPDEINYVREVAHPAVAPDESYIIVDSAYEQGGRLVGSLYVSFRRPDGSWTKAVSMHHALEGTEADVYAIPRLTPDGKYLFFEEYERHTDSSDIYWVSTDVLAGIRSKVLE
jgi:hypothetical protein